MKTLLIIFSIVFTAGCALAQVPPPPAASQTEVNNGTVKNKYVSPATLSAWTGGGTNSPSAGFGLTKTNNTFNIQTNAGAADAVALKKELYTNLPSYLVSFSTSVTNFAGPTNPFVLNNGYQIWNTGTNVALTNVISYGTCSFGILTISNTSGSSISVLCTNLGTAIGTVTTNLATVPSHKCLVVSVGGQSSNLTYANAPSQ